MNYITTNIRFPEDMYMEIKMEAMKQKKSFAAIVREKFSKEGRSKNTNTEKFMESLENRARKNSKDFKGKSASDLIIEMRYEQ